ncbi:MAG: ATP-dependent Clp protease protease subunit [Verrucomicrobiales bacterium]|jgi:ATP-dependent Clp protease protease subunit
MVFINSAANPTFTSRQRVQGLSLLGANLPLAFAQRLDRFEQTFRNLMTPFTASQSGDDYRNFIEERLLKTRTIMIYGGINQALAQDVSEKLILLANDSDADITIYLNSQGGHVEAGDTIFDMIRHVTPRVRIVGTGWVASAGALIYAAPPKDCRFALPNTRFMLHQPSGGVGGTTSDVKIEVEELIKMRRRLNQIFADQTGQSIERVADDSDRNFWMTAQEAVDYGLAGSILNSAAELK